MKTSFISTLFLTTTVLLTSACTPEDKAITDPATRAKIMAQNNKKAGGGQKKTFKLGGYQVSSLLMDKQIEAIELVRLALQADDGSKSRSQIKDKLENANGHTAILSLDAAPLVYTQANGDFKVTVNKSLKVSLVQNLTAGDWNLSLTASAPVKQSLDRSNPTKLFANLFEKSFEVTANTIEQNEVKIVLKSSGDLNGLTEDKSSFKETFEMNVTVLLDKNSLSSDLVKINKVVGRMEFKKATGKPFVVEIQGGEQSLKASGFCNTLVGSSVITTDKNAKKIVFTEQQVEIPETFFKAQLVECGKRPTVDLSRLLQ